MSKSARVGTVFGSQMTLCQGGCKSQPLCLDEAGITAQSQAIIWLSMDSLVQVIASAWGYLSWSWSSLKVFSCSS